MGRAKKYIEIVDVHVPAVSTKSVNVGRGVSNGYFVVFKYHFHDSAEIQSGHETKNKKRKVFQTTKRNSIKDYSYIKLPAPMFAHYLEFDCQNFINDCLRYLKISPVDR
jgi:hypothetical protein